MSGISRSPVRRMVLAGIVAVVVVVASAWFAVDRRSRLRLPAAEQARLVAAVVPLVEAGSADTASGERLACAAQVFGTSPADAETAQSVTIAYVWAQCAVLDSSTDTTSFVPTAVHPGSPARVEAPSDADWTANVKKIFPKRLQDTVFGQDGTVDLSPAMQARVRELS